MKLSRTLRTALSLAIIAAVLYSSFQRDQQIRRERNTELVDSLRIGGDRYDLYFHREVRSYNSIRKNGTVVFDGSQSESIRGCVQELMQREGKAFRRCYKNLTKEVVLVALP